MKIVQRWKHRADVLSIILAAKRATRICSSFFETFLYIARLVSADQDTKTRRSAALRSVTENFSIWRKWLCLSLTKIFNATQTKNINLLFATSMHFSANFLAIGFMLSLWMFWRLHSFSFARYLANSSSRNRKVPVNKRVVSTFWCISAARPIILLGFSPMPVARLFRSLSEISSNLISSSTIRSLWAKRCQRCQAATSCWIWENRNASVRVSVWKIPLRCHFSHSISSARILSASSLCCILSYWFARSFSTFLNHHAWARCFAVSSTLKLPKDSSILPETIPCISSDLDVWRSKARYIPVGERRDWVGLNERERLAKDR